MSDTTDKDPIRETVFFPTTSMHQIKHIRVAFFSRASSYLQLELHQGSFAGGGLSLDLHDLSRPAFDKLMLSFADERTIDHDKQAEKSLGTAKVVESAA